MSDEGMQNISQEVRAAIRKEAVQQTAKWAIGAIVVLVGFALTGWWFFFEPKLRDYIANAAGGVPVGAVIASTAECKDLSGKWTAFAEGTGRFLVGAGTETHRAYAMWDMALPQGGVQPTPVSTYVVLAKGGEEEHQLTLKEMPEHTHSTVQMIADSNVDGVDSSGFPSGDHHNDSRSTGIAGEGRPHNNKPPFIALYYCKK